MLAGNSVAYDIVQGSAYTLGEALVVKRSRDTAVFCREVIDQAVDFSRTHSFADMGGDMIQDGSVERRALSDGGNLPGGFYHGSFGDDLALGCQSPKLDV